MELNAKLYARRILLIHLLLLTVVLALVALASREIYNSTRGEVIAQAKLRQALLASQTARGIESHYESILNNLDLLRRAENEEGTSTTAPAEPSLPDRRVAAAASAGRGALIGPILWKQLEGRASLLVSLDRSQLTRATPTIRIIGTNNPSLSAEQIVTQSRDWLERIEKPSVSDFQVFNDVGANLVCIPFPPAQTPEPPPRPGPGSGLGSNPGQGPGPGPGGPDRPGEGPLRNGGRIGQRLQPPRDEFRLLVAVVPIHEVEDKFLKSLNDDPQTGAWLIDDRMTAMAASRPQLVGANMSQISDADVRNLATDYVQHGRAGTEVVSKSFSLGTVTLAPSLVSGEPILVAGKTWELFIATSLSQTDGVVNQLFHRAALWGIFVVISVTAILVSTAFQMIRSRLRLERVQHKILNRELTQAREIQLAWLPGVRPSMKSIDIAAINSPASHISGDFYNWFELPDGRLVVTIGDVTGHGMSAAFLMATTQLLVRNTMARLGDPGQCLEEVNRQLCVQVFNGQFVTMLIAVVDVTRSTLEVATAGHPAPLLADGESFQPLPLQPQLVLGVERDTQYLTERYPLPAQASLLLYTDGIVECLGTSGSRFSTERLQRALYGRYDNAQAMLDRVVSAVDSFRGQIELGDDLTLVALQLQAIPAEAASVAAGV